MSLKEKIENNLVIFFLSALLTGFGAGLGAYRGALEIARLDTVTKNSYVLKDELEAKYVEKAAHEAVTAENMKLKEALKRQAGADRARVLTSLSTLVSEANSLKGKRGDELVSGFDAWIQKGMQVTKGVDEEAHRLFNNNVYFGKLRTRNPSQTEIERDIQQRVNQGIAILEGAMMVLGSSGP